MALLPRTLSRTVRRSLVASVTIVAALGVAGCGNEGQASGAEHGSAGSTTSTADGALGKDEIMRTAYDAAVKAGTAHITMTMSGQAALKAQGDVSYRGGQSSMQMKMSMPQMGSGAIEMRMVKGIMYMQMPGVTPPGKFVAIDPRDKNSPLAQGFAGTTDQLDPLKSLRTMESSVKSAKRVGTDTIGGTEVEHYKVTVDTAALTKQLGAAAQQVQMPDTIVYDLWLDAQHRMRKMVFGLSGIDFKAEMSKWGSPVTVTKPSPDQIVKPPQA